MTRHRLVLTLIALLAASLGGAAWWGESRPQVGTSGARPVASPAAASSASLPAADVLREWDQARAAAFARGDAAAVAALYVPGSGAGTSDLATLRAYRSRGLRVEGMRMQVLSLVVLARSPGRLRLAVTDRLVGAVAVGGGRRLGLPRDRASARVVELRRVDGAWRVAWVRDASPRRGER